MTVHEANCQLKYDVWASGSAANDGLAGSGYNATSTAGENVTLQSGVTAQKQTAATDYISVPHGAAIDNGGSTNLATWEFLFRWDGAGGSASPMFFGKDSGGAGGTTYGLVCYYYSSKIYICAVFEFENIATTNADL